MGQRHETEAYLGEFIADLTAEQVDQIHAAFEVIEARYPDADDSDAAEAARTAATQVVLGDATTQQAAYAWRAARLAEREAMAALTGALIVEVAGGAREATLATTLDLNRMTVRKALGK